MLHKFFTNAKMFNPTLIIVLCHQDIKIPCGQYNFNIIIKLLVAQKFINYTKMHLNSLWVSLDFE